MRLTCMRGFPGSGKSTTARELADDTGAVIVNRDNIRLQLYGKYDVGPDGEEAVTAAERAMVNELLDAGRSVIIDATHLNPKYLKNWAKVATDHGAVFDIHDVMTEADQCIINDASIDRTRAGKSVGHAVITQLSRKWPIEKWPVITQPPLFRVTPYVPPKDGKPAIIVDIDGTLAHKGERSPYDYGKVMEDTVDNAVATIVKTHNPFFHILVVSGREDVCMQETHRWLEANDIPYDKLWMRKASDNRKDSLVKYEIFNEHIRNEYDVLFVLDDRDQVVKMWRELGLKCLQVEVGNF